MPISRNTQSALRPPVADITQPHTLLLATDLQRTILAELSQSGPIRLVYTAYGAQSRQRVAGTHLGFNGQIMERLTGGYHLGNGHRVYNPVLMRFHSPDRLSPFAQGGLNAYAYCGGDPVNFEDPSGEFAAAIARLIGSFETITGHMENIASAVLRSRPRGLLGYASVSSNVGYAGLTAGAAMEAAGYPAGAVFSNVGAVLVSAGNGVKALHGAAQVVKNSRWGRAVAQRMVTKRPPADELDEVIVSMGSSGSGMTRVQMPPAESRAPKIETNSRKIRTA